MDRDSVPSVERVPHGSEPEAAGIDFSANVNPETPPGIEAAFQGSFADSKAYPDDTAPAYRRAAADYVDVDPGQVIPTPGGLAAIRLALSVTVSPGDSVLVPYPSFGEYAREVRLQGATPEFVPHDTLLDADPSGHALAIVCNPNNPTGEAADPDRLREFVAESRATDTPVLVDEAFLGFTDQPTLSGTPGVIVARSLTKLFGLPGLRAGFAVATGSLRDRLERARLTWNLGVPAMQVGTQAMRATEFIERTRKRVRQERSQLVATLDDRYEIAPSDAPFLLLAVDGSVSDLLAKARERGIILRDARTFRGLDSHVRAAIRLPSENRRLEEVLLNV
ncbi:pyridoxal phosphate-dependent class II aminotransferase [Halodesulfurarchaeum sp. HSR-GB]|uniref:pyridoxal phosphate-dependent aminotransferase n=1 Tax=Halodesulfurarchaeum sp. HSR-GB TaxID=3074077 RepID=UPI00285CD8FD|nr:pyridoxal phosphate-dependent class II aminotransferase [Halodesulfurarchaeum sp. HSR-GB]MDR5656474.1 pyridoxal phosphate-dependent class II aminotransferase [Halodesulfurarchaeum sp. HSR-GB]